MANAFDGSGFVGYGVLEEFQDAAEKPVLTASTKGGVLGTVGGVLRVLDRFFHGRIKLDTGAKKRIIFGEDNSTALVEGLTYDEAGAPSADPVFETVVAADGTLPTVLSVNPLNGAVAVPITSLVTLTFSEDLDPSSINTSTIQLLNGITPIDGRVKVDGAIVTFYPSLLLPAATVLTVKATTGVTDLVGNAMLANFLSTFTTA